jgi:hypothetical protein
MLLLFNDRPRPAPPPSLFTERAVIDLTQKLYLRVETTAGEEYLTPKAFSHAVFEGHLQSRYYSVAHTLPDGVYAYDYDETTDSYISTQRRAK